MTTAAQREPYVSKQLAIPRGVSDTEDQVFIAVAKQAEKSKGVPTKLAQLSWLQSSNVYTFSGHVCITVVYN